MVYNLVLGGYRDTIPLVSFDPDTAKIKVVSEASGPEAPSWVEAAKKPASGEERVIYCVSENEKEGEVVSIKLKGDKMEVTSKRKTRGAPCHILTLKDGSGIIVANYMGGTVVFFPTEQDGSLSQSSESPDLEFPFVYKDRKAPNEERQDSPHLHQAVEGPDGNIYCPDLGNDRVWVVQREGESALKVKGWLQCPEGAGPRHCAITPDAKHLYVLTELSHQILVFPLNDSSYPKHPTPQAEGNIVPPTVPKTHQTYMDAGECVLHPSIPNVVYASNRWELHLKEKNPDLPETEPKQTGDAIAVVLLSKDGSQIEEIKHIRTGCDTVRGMRISHDGKYIALGGQEGGGLEFWEVSGERGDVWKLAAKDESIKSITDCLWL